MVLKFNGSKTHTIGVEIELQILDSKSLDLTPMSEILLEKAAESGLQRVKAEIHQSMLEIDSEISNNVKECTDFLRNRGTHLNAIAHELGYKLAILGTHPFQRWIERRFSSGSRYQNLHSRYQWLARRMNVYGLHVHIGVKSGPLALAISNAAVKYLPHLLALTANSPFWQGHDTGMNSSRINVMNSFPFSGLPVSFNNWSEFEYYYETLNRTGVISSLKDLYWYIRPNLNYGTIEFRICDALSSLEETMAIVALIQCLVVYLEERISQKPIEGVLTREDAWISVENLWIAARDGLEGIIITDTYGKREKLTLLTLELIEKLGPIAKSLECFDELQSIKTIIFKGNGAVRQKNKFLETESLKEVVEEAIREFDSSFRKESNRLCEIINFL